MDTKLFIVLTFSTHCESSIHFLAEIWMHLIWAYYPRLGRRCWIWVYWKLMSSAEFIFNLSIQNFIPFLVLPLFPTKLRLIKGKGSMKPSHAVWGHPRRMGHGGEVWQNVVHWRREWQTISVFLPWEPHEQHGKAKRQDTERWTSQVGTSSLVSSSWDRKIKIFLLRWKWKSLNHVRLFATSWTIQSMEFSRPEYWSG